MILFNHLRNNYCPKTLRIELTKCDYYSNKDIWFHFWWCVIAKLYQKDVLSNTKMPTGRTSLWSCRKIQRILRNLDQLNLTEHWHVSEKLCLLSNWNPTDYKLSIANALKSILYWIVFEYCAMDLWGTNLRVDERKIFNSIFGDAWLQSFIKKSPSKCQNADRTYVVCTFFWRHIFQIKMH